MVSLCVSALEGERGGADIRMDACLIPGDIGPIMGLPMVGTELCLYIFNHFFKISITLG